MYILVKYDVYTPKERVGSEANWSTEYHFVWEMKFLSKM